MGKKHLKRLNAPNTWNIKKKGLKYIKRPYPGPHNLTNGIPLMVFLRDILKLAKTNKEAKSILKSHEILVDGLRRKEVKFNVGFLDTISAPYIKEYYRIIFDSKGRLTGIKIDEKESKLKICKIIGKTMLKGKKMQINLSDGKNITDNTDSKIQDSVLIEVPKVKIKQEIKLEKGALVFLIGGKHRGSIAKVEDIKENIMKCKSGDDIFETRKKYAFVIGKDKALIKVQ